MALLMIEGFDRYGAVSKIIDSNKWTAGDVSNGGAATLTTGAYGGSALTAGGNGNYLSHVFNAATYATIVIGARIKMSLASNSNAYVYYLAKNTDNHIVVAITNSGTIVVCRGTITSVLATSTNNLNPGSWYYIEVKATISDTVGRVQVNVDGVEWIDTGTVDTCTNSSYPYIDRVVLLPGDLSGASPCRLSFDDLYIADTTGDNNNTMLGDCRVSTIYPAADTAAKNFSRSAGSDNFSLVNETPIDDDTSYVYASGTGTEDNYTLSTFSTTGLGVIKGVQLTTRARKDDATTRGIKNALVSGVAATQYGAELLIPQTYKCAFDIWEVNPDGGGAWTGTTVNALKTGFKVST